MRIGILMYLIELLPFKLLILAIPAFIAWRRTRSLPYVLSFALFGIYLLTVIQVALLPLDVSPEYVRMMRQSASWQQNVNLIPFYFGPYPQTLADVLPTMAQNVLLTLPFGFGLSFVVRVRLRVFLALAPASGLVIELAQLAISLLLGYPYRVVDINDVLMNGLGVLVGYGLFQVFIWLFTGAVQRLGISPTGLVAYVYNVALRAQTDASGPLA